MSRSEQRARRVAKLKAAETQVITVPCPTCGARIGQSCRITGKENGGDYTYPHGRRMNRASNAGAIK